MRTGFIQTKNKKFLSKNQKNLSGRSNKNFPSSPISPQPKSYPINKNIDSVPRKLTIKDPASNDCNHRSIDDMLDTYSIMSEFNSLLSNISSLLNKIGNVHLTSTSNDDILSISNTMSYMDLYLHLRSLRTDYVSRLGRPLIQKLFFHSLNQGIFNVPVDPIKLGIPDYFEKVKFPMDLGTIRSRLQRGEYETLTSLYNDIRKVFDNAISFNPPANHIHQLSIALKNEFMVEQQNLEDRYCKELDRKANHSCSLCAGSTCVLCGEKCLKFEPPVLVCFGTCCQRIKKGSVYYIAIDGAMQWCQKCFIALPPVVVENYGGQTNNSLLKKSLLKRRSDEEVAEPWVECDTCNSWMHQICGLYVGSHMSNENSNEIVLQKFECPMCKLKNFADNSVKLISSKSSLQQLDCTFTTRLSDSVTEVDNDSHSINIIQSSKIESDSDELDVVIDNRSFDGEPIKSKKLNIYQVSPTSISKSQSNHELNLLCKIREEDSISENRDSYCHKRKYTRYNNRDGELELFDDATDMSVMSESENESFHCTNLINSQFLKQWRASDLPKTKLSLFLESVISDLLTSKGFDSTIDSITIRVVSNRDQILEVPKPIFENMMSKDGKCVPESLGFKQKCILLFQTIDGIDVCLFSLYVQEFDKNCPPPNTSTVYISYLDSVDYFRPIEARTIVYHEIIIGYFKWCQMRGFKQGHIWSCPPQRGDNFIFWSHPSQQKTPSRERLNSWYNDILTRCTKCSILQQVNTLYDAYFAKYSIRKKDESSLRQAAKNSFVGSGKICKKFSKDDKSNSESSSSVVSVRENSNDSTEGPVSPPIFDGDFWILEFLRNFKLLNSKSKVIGDDAIINHRKCRDILRSIATKSIATTFNQPVDPVLLNIPHYFTVIKSPMDLDTIRNNLRNGNYNSMLEFAKDVRLTFDNAMLFNPSGHIVHSNAKSLWLEFQQTLISLISDCVLDVVTPENLDSHLARYPLNVTDFDKTPRSSSSCSMETGRCNQRTRVFFAELPIESTPRKSTEFDQSERVSFHDGYDQAVVTDLNFTSDSAKTGSSRPSSLAWNHVIEQYGTDGESAMEREDTIDYFEVPPKSNPTIRSVSDEFTTPCDGEFINSRRYQQRNNSIDSMTSICSEGFSFDEGHINPLLCTMSADETMQQPWLPNRSDMNANIRKNETDKGFNANLYNTHILNNLGTFSKSALGLKMSNVLMSELSKSVFRLKDDLFVVHFKSPSSMDKTKNESTQSESLPAVIQDQPPVVQEKVVTSCGIGARKLVRTYRPKAINYSRLHHNNQSYGEFLSARSQHLLRDIKDDTSDPDADMLSPLVDNRHTFLEMCQFRHYQFDTLRRAKYSSLMILQHLHNPDDIKSRVTCTHCKSIIRNIRWHCDQCANFDICQDCNQINNGRQSQSSNSVIISETEAVEDVERMSLPHTHLLTPFRVTYV
eukprot:gene7672-10441_t